MDVINIDNERKYYVYEWIRLDTNEPFYVGKGFGDRAYRKKRGNNKHFNNIVANINTCVVILHKNLTESESLGYEVYYINYYQNEYGFDLANLTFGGEGVSGLKHTEKIKNKYSLDYTGININDNKEYIIDLYVNKNKSTIEIGKILNISKTTVLKYLKIWGISIRNNSESKKGKYAKEESVHYGKKHSEERKRKNSEGHKGLMTGKDSPISVRIGLYDINNLLINMFYTQKDCVNYLLELKISNTYGSILDGIYRSIKNDKSYKGYYFKKFYDKSG